MCTYIHTYILVHNIYIYIHIYIYEGGMQLKPKGQKERDRETGTETETDRQTERESSCVEAMCSRCMHLEELNLSKSSLSMSLSRS